ncbi:MAG: hypothetical protein ACSLE7_11790, partial [Mycobacterium sp.]
MRRLRRLARRVKSESRTLAVAATAAVVVPVVVAGCAYGPADPTRPASAPVQSSTGVGGSTDPGAVSVLPGTAPLGTSLTVKGATVTPRADNLALVPQTTGGDLELGIEISFSGVTAPIDTSGPNGGFRIAVSGGEQIPTSRPVVLTSSRLASRVRSAANGWVFFQIRPGMRPTQLQLVAAPEGYGLVPAPIAIWIMPANLPAASSPVSAPPPASPPPPTPPAAEAAPAP